MFAWNRYFISVLFQFYFMLCEPLKTVCLNIYDHAAYKPFRLMTIFPIASASVLSRIGADQSDHCTVPLCKVSSCNMHRADRLCSAHDGGELSTLKCTMDPLKYSFICGAADRNNWISRHPEHLLPPGAVSVAREWITSAYADIIRHGGSC